MPIYEFRCCACRHEFEAYCPLSGNRQDLKCPKCGQDKLEQLVSSFSTRVSGPVAAAGKSCSRFK